MKKIFNLILIFIFMLTINVKADRINPLDSCFLQEYGKGFSNNCINATKESYTYNATIGSVIIDLNTNTLTFDNYQGPGIALNAIDDNSTLNIIIKGEVIIDSECTVAETCATYTKAGTGIDILGNNITTIIRGYDINSSLLMKNAYYNISVNGDVTIENLHGSLLSNNFHQGGIYPIDYTYDLTIKNSTLTLGRYAARCDHLEIDNSSITYNSKSNLGYYMITANSTKITNSSFFNNDPKGSLISTRSGKAEIRNSTFDAISDNSSANTLNITSTDNIIIEDNTFSVVSSAIRTYGNTIKTIINNNYFTSVENENVKAAYLIFDETTGESEITNNIARYNNGGFYKTQTNYDLATTSLKKIDNNDLVLNGYNFSPLYFKYVNLELTNNKLVSTNTNEYAYTYSVGIRFDSLKGLKTGDNDIELNGKYEKGIFVTGCNFETVFENDTIVIDNSQTGLYVDAYNHNTIFDNVDLTIKSNNVKGTYDIFSEKLIIRNSKLTIINTDDSSATEAAIAVQDGSFTAENSEIYITNKYNSDIGKSNKSALRFLSDWGASMTFDNSKVVIECDGAIVLSNAIMGSDSLIMKGDYDFIEEGLTFNNGLYDKDGKTVFYNLTIDKIYFYDNIVINPDKVNEETETLSVMINGNNKNFTSIEISDLELLKDTDYIVEGNRKTVISFTKTGIDKLNSLKADTYETTFNYSNDKKVIGNIIIERLYTYLPIEGNNKSVVNKLDEFSFRIDGKFDLFDNIEINGLDLIKDVDYTVTEGSTIITFTESGLNKLNQLGTGEHNIKVNYTNGEQSTINFEITLPDINNPQTGDSLLISILVLMITCIMMFIINKKYLHIFSQ